MSEHVKRLTKRKFTLENTEGFTVKELEKLNEVYERQINELTDIDCPYYQEMCQKIAEDILDNADGYL